MFKFYLIIKQIISKYIIIQFFNKTESNITQKINNNNNKEWRKYM
jgi:hypothetical protein